MIVAVPARNEARRLPRLLAALAAQHDAPPFALALLLDRCTDASAAVVVAAAADLPFAVHVRPHESAAEPHAGRARAAVCAMAADLAGERGVLLTTDADSAPAPGWIAANLAGLAHADIVAGRVIRRAGTSPMQDRVELYYDRLHALRRMLDPVAWEDDGTHHWTSGASLALRAATYRRLGGFPCLPHGEDAALADRASRLGLRVRRDARAVVRTSARRHGRVEGGFAAALARLDSDAAMPMVGHPEDEAWRYRHHAILRRHGGGRAEPALAAAIGITVEDLARVIAEVPNGEALAARAVGAPPGGMRHVPLPLAEAALTAIESPPLAGAA